MLLLAAMLRLAALRWLGVCVILLTPLSAANLASAHELVQTKTRVGGFESAAPLHIWLNGSATERSYSGNLRCEPEVASESLLAARAGAAAERLVIGRGADLAKPGALKAGERALSWPSKMPNAAAEWKINSGLLRQEMQRRLPIRDISPGDTGGMFLNAERNLLQNQGWTFDASSRFWMPPVP
mgnify:CR=1 FL=1